MLERCAQCGNEVAADARVCPSCGVLRGVASSTGPVDPANGGAPGDATDLQIGELVENAWRVRSVIGRGGMGTVFLADDERLGRAVALKTLSMRSEDPEFAERFLREGRVLAALDHPNVVGIHGVGRHRGIPFIAMKYLEGKPLGTLLRERGGKLPPGEALSIARQLASALADVHARGVVHRDLKPANIIVGADGHVTLFDFGIARPTGSALTKTGIVYGTPGYMAPEVIVGEKHVDGRADQYSLSVVLFELLSGFAPFIDADEERMLMLHLTAPRPKVSEAGGIPPLVDVVIARAMAVEPAGRYPDILEFCTALEAAFGVEVDQRETIKRAPIARPLKPDGSINTATGIPSVDPGLDAPTPRGLPPRAASTADPSAPPRTVSRPGTVPAAGAGRTVSRPGTVPAVGAAAAPGRTMSRPGTVPAADPLAGGTAPPRTVSRPGTVPATGAQASATGAPQRTMSRPGTIPVAGAQDSAAGAPQRTLSRPGTIPAADPTVPGRAALPAAPPGPEDPTPPGRGALARSGEGVGTDPLTPAQSEAEATALVVDRWVRRHRGKIAAAIALVLLLGFGLAFLFERPQPPPPPQPIPIHLVGLDVAHPAAPVVQESAEATQDVLDRIEKEEQRSEQAQKEREKRTAMAHPSVKKKVLDNYIEKGDLAEIQVKVTLDHNDVAATVAVDGEWQGAAPAIVPVKPGNHTVRVLWRPFPESVIPVEVKSRAGVVLDVELRPIQDLVDGPTPLKNTKPPPVARRVH